MKENEQHISIAHIVRHLETISKRLDVIENKIAPQKYLHVLPHKYRSSNSAGELLYDNEDLCFLFRVSKRTLQRYRDKGVLPYQKHGREAHYTQTDIDAFRAFYQPKEEE